MREPPSFKDRADALRETVKEIQCLSPGDDLSIEDVEAIVQIIQHSVSLVNMFPLARRDTTIVLDSEVVREELALMVEPEEEPT